jgi:hypothetical protein
LVAALSTSLLQLFRFGEKWRLYRNYCQRLVAEGWHLAQGTGTYEAASGVTNTFKSFVDEVETLLKSFETEYQADAIILRDQKDNESSAAGARANQDRLS